MSETSGQDQTGSKQPAFGVLLVNLGTPEAATTGAVRRFLREFLSDRRVIDTPRLLWWFILNAVILLVRPAKVAKLYQAVWTEDGSPLLAIGKRQAAALSAVLRKRYGSDIPVALAMTYGEPSMGRALTRLREAGCQGVLVLPLYPQYSATTTAAAFDALAVALKQTSDIPEIRLVKSYAGRPSYIEALAASVAAYWQANGRPERLLMSFHGIPERYVEQGDPYVRECQLTAKALAGALELEPAQWQASFQSRFGPAEWVKPYTDKTLEQWGKEGVGRVDVICPAFTADCLETLEEIALQNREVFIGAGGGEYHYITALNDSELFIDALADEVERHTGGWC